MNGHLDGRQILHFSIYNLIILVVVSWSSQHVKNTKKWMNDTTVFRCVFLFDKMARSAKGQPMIHHIKVM